MRINKNKRIGNIVIIVEGAITEFEYFEEIFHTFLGYEVISSSRINGDIKVLKGHDKYSKVYIFSAPTNNVDSIKNEETFEEFIYSKINLISDMNVFNYPTYIVFDRDPKNNKYKIVKDLLIKFNNSLKDDDTLNGLLLLSYPSLESFLITLNLDDAYKLKLKLGKEAKEYIKSKNYTIKDLTQMQVSKAYNNFVSFLTDTKLINTQEEILNFGKIGLDLFEFEQEKFKKETLFYCVSQVIEILIDLQIIEI